MTGPQARRRIPLEHHQEGSRLEDAIHERVERRTQAMRESVIPASNVQCLKHGQRWQAAFADRPGEITDTALHSMEITIPLKSIVDHDLDALVGFLIDFPDKMHKQFMSTMFKIVEDSTATTGNIVSGMGFKEGFKEALEKIKFGVNRWGVPTSPELHVGPEIAKKIEYYIKNPDPAYEAEVQKITDEKEREALAEEARRVARYKFG